MHEGTEKVLTQNLLREILRLEKENLNTNDLKEAQMITKITKMIEKEVK
jgi:hypothetical protein